MYVIGIANAKDRQRAIDQMRAGLIVDPIKNDTASINDNWRDCERMSEAVPQATFDTKLASFLRDLACRTYEGRNILADAVYRNWLSDIEHPTDFSTQLARGLLGMDGQPCVTTVHDEQLRKCLLALVPTAASTSTSPVSRDCNDAW